MTWVKTIRILVILLGYSILNAQTPIHNWVVPLVNNTQLLQPPLIHVLDNGDVILGGLFQGTLDFDFTDGEELRKGKVFILKMSADRKLQWVTTLNADQIGPSGFDMDVDAKGNVYFTGQFFRTIEETFADQAPIELLNHPNDFENNTYIIKLNGQNGGIINLITVKDEMDKGGAKPLSLAVSNKGKIGLLGYFTKSVTLRPNGEPDQSNGETDIYFIQFDNEGQYEWHKTFGNEEYDYGTACDFDSEENVYIGGNFYYTTDFDNGEGEYIIKNNGQYDVFILKLSPNGKIIRGQSFGSARTDRLNDLHIGPKDEIWVSGFFGGRMDIDPSQDKQELIYTTGEFDALVFGLNPNGELLWYKAFGGLEYDDCSHIFVDKAGNVYAHCFMKGESNYRENNMDLSLPGTFNSLVLKWLHSGELEWAYALNSYYGNTSTGNWPLSDGDIAVGSQGALYTSGVFAYGLDFDPSENIDSVTVESIVKMYLHNMTHCSPDATFVDTTSVDTFILSNGDAIKEEGVYLDTLINSKGCDSIVEYNLQLIDKIEALNALKIGPNPSYGFLNFYSEVELLGCQLSIFNDLGQLVWKTDHVDILAPKTTVEYIFPNVLLPTGVYIFRLENGGRVRNFKVMVL